MLNRTLLLFFILSTITLTSFAQVTYPPRIYGDSLHAPFYHGVASGDPLTNAVIIWTRISPAPADYSPLTVNYQFATDSLFTSIISTGSIITDSSFDWTIKKDITGLSPNTIYYYRFDDGLGNYSTKGKTRTAPTGNIPELKFAVFSCSSIFSGFFNGYAMVAEKSDSINAAIHLGDYIYDYVDAEEQVRVPLPYPTEPANLEEWRDRHDYYLLDPDLRAAKASLPWIILWDNHDQECGGYSPCYVSPGTKAFLEWTPIRLPDTSNQLKIYRTLSYGSFAYIFIADILMFRENDTLLNGEYNLLGTNQYNWLTQQLQASTAKWKIVGQQRMMGGWYTNGISQWLLDLVPNNGPIFDDRSWDGYPGTKALFFDFLRTNFIDNVIVLSGDQHISVAQDLVEDPNNISLYDPVTGNGSVGVEFLPTSITRGNLDEAGAPIGAAAIFTEFDMLANPQHQFVDLYNHGYGLLHLRPDSTIAQFWYNHKLTFNSFDSLGATLIVKDTENHWSRTSGFSFIDNPEKIDFNIFPNPANDYLTIQFEEIPTNNIIIEVVDALGKSYLHQSIANLNYGNLHLLDIRQIPAGLYLVRLNNWVIKKFIKQ